MPARTIVLLGAGASRDAGLPLTGDLAELLVARANAEERAEGWRRQPSGVAELNFIYSAMVGHQGEDGSDPLRAVNIETLISAVRLLQSRESHEVAPFVASWKEGASGFPSSGGSIGRDYSYSMKRALERAIEDRHFGAGDLADVVVSIARDVMRRPDTVAFNNLEALLLRGIREVLADVDTVAYLQPLAELASAQAGGLDIITLNYDLTVERLAEEGGIEIDRGIERWVPGQSLGFEQVDGRINLLKLHGSVDWELVDRSPRTVHPPQIKLLEPEVPYDPDDDSAPPRHEPGLPWIVVGDREKLATDGPTLDLLHAARTALNEADSLVVVGYSFADAHVNAMVRNWMAASADRTLTVIDPSWPSFEADEPRGHLAKAYGGSDDWNSPGEPPRIVVLKETAATALSKVFSVQHAVEDPLAEAHWSSLGAVEIRYFGQPMTGVSVSGFRGGASSVSVARSEAERDDKISRPISRNAWTSAQIGDLDQGATVTVYPVLPPEPPEIKITIEGDHLVGHRIIEIPLPAPPDDAPRAAPPGEPQTRVVRTPRSR